MGCNFSEDMGDRGRQLKRQRVGSSVMPVELTPMERSAGR